MPALCMAEDTFFFVFGFGREEDKTLMNNRLTMTGSVVPYDAMHTGRSGFGRVCSMFQPMRTLSTQVCRCE